MACRSVSFTGLKQTENGAMNAGGDMSSKTGSIEIKSYEKNLNWFMRVKLIYRFSFAPKVAAQSITITVGPATDDSYWVWNEEYQCWIWNGPEFQGDYEGHPYSYWHGRHHEEWGRDHRPGKGERSEGERPVNKGDVEQPRAEQPKAEVERPNAEQHKAEAEKPKEQQGKAEVEKPKAEEKAKTENPKEEEKSKKEKPKPEEKKDDSKPKGE